MPYCKSCGREIFFSRLCRKCSLEWLNRRKQALKIAKRKYPTLTKDNLEAFQKYFKKIERKIKLKGVE